MSEDGMRKRVFQGALWIGGGKALTNAIGFAGTVIIARLLAPDDFGIVAIAAGFAALLNGLTSMSPEAAIIASEKSGDSTVNTAWTIAVIRSTVIATTLAALAPLIAGFYKDSRLSDLLHLFAFIFFVSGFANPRLALLQKSLQFKQDFFLSLAGKISYTLTCAVVAYMTKSYWSIAVGIAASQLIPLFFGYVVAPYRPRFCLAEYQAILRFSMWMSLSSIVSTVNFRVDHLLIGSYLGPKAVGNYVVSDELSAIPTREIGTPLNNLLFASMAAVKNDKPRMHNAYFHLQPAIFAILAPAGVGLGLVAYILVPLIYGEKWLSVVPVVTLLASIYGIQSFQLGALPLAMAASRPDLIAKRDFVTLLIRVAAIIGGGIYAGLMGVIVGRAFVNCIAIAISMISVRELIGASISLQIWKCIRSIISLIVMSAFVTFVSTLFDYQGELLSDLSSLFIIAISGVATYIGTHLILWVLQGFPEGPERLAVEALGSWGRRIRAR